MGFAETNPSLILESDPFAPRFEATIYKVIC
jgi:hypothetical protein